MQGAQSAWPVSLALSHRAFAESVVLLVMDVRSPPLTVLWVVHTEGWPFERLILIGRLSSQALGSPYLALSYWAIHHTSWLYTEFSAHIAG